MSARVPRVIRCMLRAWPGVRVCARLLTRVPYGGRKGRRAKRRLELAAQYLGCSYEGVKTITLRFATHPRFAFPVRLA